MIFPAILFIPLALSGAMMLDTSPILGRVLVLLAVVDVVAVFVFGSVVRTILTTVLYHRSGPAPEPMAAGAVPPGDGVAA